MTGEERIQAAISSLDRIKPCPECGMRYRVGDAECPQRGGELDDMLRDWAEGLIAEIAPDQE